MILHSRADCRNGRPKHPMSTRKNQTNSKTKHNRIWDFVWGILLLVCMIGLILLLSHGTPVQKVGPDKTHSTHTKAPSPSGL